MGLADLTRQSVEMALDEFDQLGRDEFLVKYGFGHARAYFVWRNGVAYDSKAICGAAHARLGEGSRPLTPSDFSGGDKTVAARLERLGFEVLSDPFRMRVGDDRGGLLKATCELHRKGDRFVITLQSRGGAKGSTAERNPDYFAALRMLLNRLATAEARLEAVLLDTGETRHMPEADRRLLDAAPLRLAPGVDVEGLVSTITKAAAAISRSGTRKGGNPTKQIQLRFSATSLPTTEAVRRVVVLGSPRVFVLTWNPDVWTMSEEELRRLIEQTGSGNAVQDRWATGNRTSGISAGDHVVLLRQSTERGIVAHGVAASEVYQAPHFNDPTRDGNYIDVLWDEWLDTEDRLPIEALPAITSTTNWNAFLASGNQLPPSDASAVLEALSAMTKVPPLAVPGDENVIGLPEGARKTVIVNRYERNRLARQQCLAAHGTACKVCGIDFGVAYGGLADGFIHVHHVVPISSVGSEYTLDPINDLVPVCPNCHAMLHHGVREPRSPENLRNLLASANGGGRGLLPPSGGDAVL